MGACILEHFRSLCHVRPSPAHPWKNTWAVLFQHHQELFRLVRRNLCRCVPKKSNRLWTNMRWETVATNIRFWARQPYTSRKVSNILSSCHRKSHVIKLRPCASRNDVGIYVTIRTLLWYLRSSLKIKCNFKGLRWQILNKNMSSSSLHTHQHKAQTLYLCTRAKSEHFFLLCTQFQSIYCYSIPGIRTIS